MGDYGKVAVSAGYARFDSRDFGKIGAGYTYKGDFDNANIGYTLGANANALIGRGSGVNGEVYAGLDLGKESCTQFNVGLLADYTKTFKDSKIPLTNIGESASSNPDLSRNQSLKAGGLIGFTRNICCDDDKRFSLALTGGAEFHPSEPEVDMAGREVKYSNKLNKVSPFLGAKAEYAKKVNRNGNEIFFSGKCYISEKASTYGEAGIGFRF